MTPQQIVGLAVRLFAIWLVLTALRTLELGRQLESQPNASDVTTAPFVISVIYAVVAVLLWLFPMTVAHNLVPRTNFQDKLHLPAREAAAVACVIFGLGIIVALALPILSRYISIAIFWVNSGQPLSAMGPSYHASLVQGIICLAVGALLIARARPIATKIVPNINSNNDPDVL